MIKKKLIKYIQNIQNNIMHKIIYFDYVQKSKPLIKGVNLILLLQLEI